VRPGGVTLLIGASVATVFLYAHAAFGAVRHVAVAATVYRIMTHTLTNACETQDNARAARHAPRDTRRNAPILRCERTLCLPLRLPYQLNRFTTLIVSNSATLPLPD